MSLQTSINKKLYNSEVIRSIDIASQVIKSNVIVSLENTGGESASSFHVPIDTTLSNHLAFISASVESCNFLIYFLFITVYYRIFDELDIIPCSSTLN